MFLSQLALPWPYLKMLCKKQKIQIFGGKTQKFLVLKKSHSFDNDENGIFRLNQAIQHLMVAWKEKDGPILPFFPVILLGYYFFPFAICAL